jgi:hypothetical protein
VTKLARTSLISLQAAALLFGGVTLAGSTADAASAKVRRACSSDVKRLCPKHKFDTPELRYCMEAKSRQISNKCVRALEDDGIIPRRGLRR